KATRRNSVQPALSCEDGSTMRRNETMKARTRKLFAIAIVTTVVSGCYETDFALLDAGEKVPFSGKYACVNRISGTKEAHTFTEEKDGVVFASYRYKDSDGSTLLAKKLPNGMFLGQSAEKGGGFGYAYFDVLDENTFLVLVADLLGKGDYI